MKLEYIANLEKLEKQYKEAELEDQEYMKMFVMNYKKRYDKLKFKMKIKVKEKTLEIRKLTRELAEAKGEDVSHLPELKAIEREAEKLKKLEKKEDEIVIPELPAVIDRRTYAEVEVQTDNNLGDITGNILMGFTPRTARSESSGMKEDVEVPQEMIDANLMLNEEVSRLHQAIEELKEHYDSKLRNKEMESMNLERQIKNLEEFKEEVMRVQEDGVDYDDEVDEDALNQMVHNVTKDTRAKEEQLRQQSQRNLTKLVDMKAIQNNEDVKEKDNEIAKLKETIAELQQQMIDSSKEDETTPEEDEQGGTDVKALEKRLEVAKTKMKQLLGQKQMLVKSIEMFKAEAEKDKLKYDKQDEELKHTLEVVEELKEEVENARQLLEAKDETILKLEKAFKTAQRQNLQTPQGAKNAERELKKLKTLQLAKEQEYKTLQQELESANIQLADVQEQEKRIREKREEEKKEYEKKLEDMRMKQTELTEKLKSDVASRIESALEKKNKEVEKYQAREDAIKQKIVTLVGELNKTRGERDDLQARVEKLEKFTTASQKMLTKLKKKIQEDAHFKDDYEVATKKLKSFQKEYDEMQGTLHSSQEKVRKLYNQIEDMKGKIRVYARCRPFNDKDPEPQETITHFIDDTSMKVVPLNDREERVYNFNRVFRPDSSQDEVFKDTKDLIRSSLDGYNVCIFAYGQTGTGKTWTITGKQGQEGLVPKAIREVYDLINKRSKLWDTTIEIQMLELYCDKLRDLLDTKDIKANFDPKVHLTSKNGSYDIKPDSHGNMVVTNTISCGAKTVDDCFSIYEEGQQARKVRKTGMNDESSRSHLIFTLHIHSVNKTSGGVTIGKLTMVDLAGSENSKKTGLEDEQAQKEALSINKSLLALGEVINALSEGRQFVPYRTNKLTQLLSDSLGGNAKTLMFVCIGPSAYNTVETINSLNYAERVKKIKNTVSKKQESKKVGQMRQMITKLKERLHYATQHNGELPPDDEDDILI
mmetsp:Transcript_13440/g.20312  ORF Transcript_13440/g.20312 Transcript_13440/m.20312 type:complete len:990 (+) Transcript_13440:473-3442(+)